MQVHIIAVGKIKEKYLQLGISEYEKRLRPYVKLQIIEISEEKRPASTSPAVESAAKEKASPSADTSADRADRCRDPGRFVCHCP